MDKVIQPTAAPTNKVAAATAALALWTIAISVSSLALKNLAPSWYDPDTMMAISTGVPTALAFVVGYFVKDKPNVVVPS